MSGWSCERLGSGYDTLEAAKAKQEKEESRETRPDQVFMRQLSVGWTIGLTCGVSLALSQVRNGTLCCGGTPTGDWEWMVLARQLKPAVAAPEKGADGERNRPANAVVDATILILKSLQSPAECGGIP